MKIYKKMMLTKLTKKLIFAMLMVLLLAGCEKEQTTQYQGGLFFGQGSYLMRLSLNDGSLSVVGHLGDTVIREISAFGEDHLLIAESASVNRRRVQRISWFDLDTGETADLYAGTRARYLPVGNMVVYDDGSDLFAVPQINGSANQVIFSHAKNQLRYMSTATDGVLLFESGEPGEAMIRSWNAVTGELRELDGLTQTCRLRGSVWIDSMQRLACKRRQGTWTGAGYVFADIGGNVDGEPDIPPERVFQALAFIESQDALVLLETSPGLLGSREQYIVWLYDILSGDMHRVPGNINLGDSIVYADF